MSSTLLRGAPSIAVAKPYIGVEEEAAAIEVLRSGWLSQGAKVAEFEQRFAKYVGAKNSIAVSSCTTALHLALLAMGIGEGDEVICPSLSFIATANAIRYVNATPVFADIDPKTYNVDPNRVEKAISCRTKAILVVHQVGLPAPMAEISDIAKRHGLLLIEDAACAIGSEYRGKLIGCPHSAVACFSFHPRKVLTTGEGGMVTTNDEQLAARLRRLRQHAMSISDLARHNATKLPFETYDEVGYNYRMTDIQAAIGIVQLQRLPEFLKRRRYLASRYTARINQFTWLTPPHQPDMMNPNFQSYMARLNRTVASEREDLIHFLHERGVSTRRGVMSIHRQAPYSQKQPLPETDAASEETIILPLFHSMTDEQQDHVLDSIELWGAKRNHRPRPAAIGV